jgi:hypothetical protein
MTAPPAIFHPEPDDNEDVVSALETADIFWAKGDADEALRWLKRAAETASDAGNDMRALAIARSAADLKSGNGTGPTSAVAETPGVRKSRAPAPPSSHSKQPPPPSSMGVVSDGSVRSPLPQKSPPPLPPSKSRESQAPAPPVKATKTQAPPARTASSDHVVAVTPQTTETPVQRAPLPSALPREPERTVTPASAYRAIPVFVRAQGHNGDKLEVIVARPGQPAPAGAEPALLVPTRRGGRLLG